MEVNMLNLRQLHNGQKQWLFDNYYVTAKCLDALVENGWQSFYIKYFNWLLDMTSNNGWHNLILDAKDGSYTYNLRVNLKDDFDILMKI